MPRRRSFDRARCLVTGASSGLGRAIAAALARAGARVVLTGRSADRLDEAARSLHADGIPPDRIATVAADLTLDDDRRRLFDRALAHLGGLDIAVNSAGVGATGHFETHDPSVLRRVFEINVFALAEVSRLALPLLREGDRPSLVNLGSIVARRGLPGRPEYTASKFAVAGFTESIRAEWARYGIHVLLLNPGFTATEFERNLVVDTAIYPVTTRRVNTPESVAAATLQALRRGTDELTLTPQGRFLLLTNRLFPRFVNWGFNRWTLHLYPDSPILRPPKGPKADA